MTVEPGADRPALSFRLTVQPESAWRPWHARLAPEGDAAGGAVLEFTSPIELLRHLVQLGPFEPGPTRPGGGLT